MKSNSNLDRQNLKRTQSAKSMSGHENRSNLASQFGAKYNNLFDRPVTEQRKFRRDSKNSMPPINFKSIKSLTNNDIIEVIPNEVIFKDIELNQTYEMVVFVQNLSKGPKRIKILQPSTSKFRVDYDTQGAIAAGLNMKLIVTFETSSLIEDYSDKIQILYETQVEHLGKRISKKNTIELPIYAYRPQPELRFQSYVNLGFCRMGKDKKYPLKFQNLGSTIAAVRLDTPAGSHLYFDPQTFQLQPLQETAITMIFNSKDTGVYRYSVEVNVQGQPISQKIDVNATSVDYNKFIIDEEGTKQESFDFGDVYYGEKKVLKGFLTNNTPKQLNYKIMMRKGIVSTQEDEGKFQTPQEQGLEITEQIMKCSPMYGVIKPYAQVPVTFSCLSKVTPKNLAIFKSFALVDKSIKPKLEEADDREEDKVVHYTCIIDYDGDDEQTTLLLHAKRIHPLIKIDKPVLNFGECSVNDHREIIFHIENIHQTMPIDIFIPRMPQFKIQPNRISLDPQMKAPFVASFIPNNVGRYQKNLDITFIDKSYNLPIKAIGQTSNVGDKRPKTRGPECLPSDFQVDRKYIDQDNKRIYQRQNLFDETFQSDQIQNKQHQNFFSNPDQLEVHKEMMEERMFMNKNKDKYVKMIREQKESRLLKQKEKILAMRVSEMEQKLQEEGRTLVKHQDESEIKDPRETCPADLEWEVKMNDVKIDQPKLELPNSQEPLFVLKPIGMYEPIKEEAFKHFNPDPNSQVKKHFDNKPQAYKDTRDIHLELDGESLQKIFAGPKEIDFGEIFVKSKVVKTFVVKNDLRNAIKVQLFTNCPELIETYQEPQIIPSSETGKFEVVLCSQGLDDEFKSNIKYVINNRHEFEFEVKAKIQQVKLETNRESIKFQFSDENKYMETSEILTLKNNGNAEALYYCDQESQKFIVEPKTAKVPSKGSVDLRITYRPSILPDNQKQQREGQQQLRTEEDNLILRVQDGPPITINCQGQVYEPKCVLKQTEINLGEILVSREVTHHFQIRNTSRIPAVFRVMKEWGPHQCTITPLEGKIPADGLENLTVKYCNSSAREINEEISIMLRGGKILKLPFYVKTIVPEVIIQEDEFDFKQITILGKAGVQYMHLKNLSNIAAELELDMRGEEEHPDPSMVPDGIEYLSITPCDDGDESILKSVQFDDNEEDQGQDPANLLDGDDLGDQEDSDSEEGMEEQHTQKLYNFVIGPNQTIKFELRFAPKEDKTYSFELPLALQRYGNKLDSLRKLVKCEGTKPKFLIDPPVVDFGKKIITNNQEKMFPQTQVVMFQNPGNQSVKWHIDKKNFEDCKEFSVHPMEGIVDGGQVFRIKASFNPMHPRTYELQVFIYIDDNKESQLEIPLKGEAAYPRLLFDRREILMPVTPLGIESKCIFKIYNEGYENMSLNSRIVDELDKLNLKLNFPEGKTMGVAKQRIRIEIVFSSNTPLSFCTKIHFMDEQGNIYTIPVSGTADNSIFTNFGYMQRNRGEFNVQADERGCIQIIDEDHEEADFSDAGSQATRKGGRYAASVGSGKTLSSRSSQKAGLGYNPIPKELLENSREIVKIWLNNNVLQHHIQNFPDDVVEDNGDQIFQMLNYLCGSVKAIQGFQVQVEKNMKRLEKATLLYQQYSDLIYYLKTEGALLNHLRPQFLLSYNDYISYTKSLPKQVEKPLHPQAIKMPYPRYQYFHHDSWVSLFYQILKLYYLSKVNSKILRNIPGVTGGEKAILPECYTSGSNLYSPQEGIIMRWLELTNDIVNQREHKLTNFEGDIVDGQILSGLIKAYLQPLSDSLRNLFLTLKPRCDNDDDNLYNSGIVHSALKDIQLSVPYSPLNLVQQSARENMLLLLQLYNSLPYYIPKGQPIIFKCVLGESVTKVIELSNPINKPISYWVKYDGSPDFKPEFEDSFKIEPKSMAKFKVTFISRISQPVKGRLTFTNKKETNIQAQALVFELKSEIVGRISIENWTINSPLYENREMQIPVVNHFENAEFGEFSVTIVHQKEMFPPKPKEDDGKKKQGMSGLKKKKKQDDDVVTFQETPFIPCFFTKQAPFKLKRRATAKITINFLPMVYETQKCYIIFSDPLVGEFQHEITGTVELPEEVIDIPKIPPIQPPVFVDEQRVYPISVPFGNSGQSNARRTIKSWLADKGVPLPKGKQQEKPVFQKQPFKFPEQPPEQLIFEVDIQQPSNQAVIASKVLTLVNPRAVKKSNVPSDAQGSSKMNKDQQSQLNPSKKLDQSEEKSMVNYSNYFDTVSMLGTNDDTSVNHLNLMFHFKIPIRDYRALITLKNNNLTDVRRYKLTLTSFPRPVKATMEMVAPSKEMVVQEIPILNNTEKDWHIKIQLLGTEEQNSQFFFVQHPPKEGEQMGKDIKDFLIRKKTTGKIPLIFWPEWICQSTARLTLTNNLTNDVFEYELKGLGEEPLAEDHLVINCIAKQTTTREITLTNPYKDRAITYKVETDLVGASGNDSITIPAKKKKGIYKLNITPILSGDYTGQITFREENGWYIWYTVMLSTESPPSVKCLTLNANLRKPMAIDIELDNPYMEPVTYEVLMEGEGLIGDQYFTILPVSSSQYELLFMPLKVGQQRGSIAFVSDRLGEIWYELNLIAEDSGVIKLPQLKCELGKTEQHEITLENPSSKEQIIRVRNSNSLNFEINPEEIVIPPYEVFYAYISYLPSALDITQQAEIVFESEDIGKWQYLCFGVGVPPTKFDPKLLTIGLNKDYSTVIHFKNPFKDPIQVKVYLDLEDYEVSKVIKLLKKNNAKIQIPGQQSIQIPFQFTPQEIREYKANIIVQMNDKIQWVYPIIGITESLSSGLLKVFKTKCRNLLESEFEVQLPGISQIKRGKDDLFNFELQNICFKEHYFKKLFEIKCIKNHLESPDDTLRFKVRFNPQKPFKQTVDLIINRQIGGLWKFKLNLESTPPQEDDIIVISSPLHKTNSVSFRLTNRKKSLPNFVAKFTPDSDAEFAVTPKTGILASHGTEGTRFTISFTPVEYGKIRKAKLIIETDEMYWSYIIKGILPKYKPPQVESNLQQQLQKPPQPIKEAETKKKNFMSMNIDKTRVESNQLHQIKEQHSQILKQSQLNRSSISPSVRDLNNNNNVSRLSLMSRGTVQSRAFTSQGARRKKKF